MSLPFDTTFYDTLYVSISSVLREKFPQHQDEDLLTWYKRLLYEFVSYLQATYEPDTVETKVPANQKNNKKKNQPQQPNFQADDETLFNTNIEQALDIVSQDSNFAVYLLAWWLPMLLAPTDTVCICLDVDCSSTVASGVKLQKLKIALSWTEFQLVAINDIQLSQLTGHAAETWRQYCATDYFIDSILRAVYHGATGEKVKEPLTLAEVKECATISLSNPDPYVNAARISNILWKIKNILEPLFVSSLTLDSNLITESLSVSKAQEEKHPSQRKRFNSRKFIETSLATPAEMSAGVLQTLAISLFRTFYDYDASTIDPALFDYLFLDQHNLTF